MRENLFRLLGISKFSSYAAVIFELNLIKMKDIVKMIKCSFLMSLIHDKGSGQCLEVLMEEEGKAPGLVKEVKEICVEFGLPDITVHDIGKERMKKLIWKKAREDLWLAVLKERRVPYQDSAEKSKKDYWAFNKRKSSLIFAYKVGNLDFRDDKKGESLRKFGSTACIVPHCPGIDNLAHVRECYGYKTKPGKYAFKGNEEELGDYLDALDAERFGVFRAPLMYRKQLGNVPKLTRPKTKSDKT